MTIFCEFCHSEGCSECAERRILTEALLLPPAQQYHLAFLIAENIGCTISLPLTGSDKSLRLTGTAKQGDVDAPL